MIEKFETFLKTTNYSENTKISYLFAIQQYNEQYEEVTQEKLKSYKVWLIENFKPQTVNLRIRAINCYLECIDKNDWKLPSIKVQQKTFLENVISQADYEYFKKLSVESEAKYNKSAQRYAAFADAYHKPVLATYSTKQTELENEMQADYQLCTTIKSQMQAAQAKLQEATPAFTVIESASVPIKPAGPKRMIISIAMMVLSFFVLSGWLLAKERM